MLSKRIHFPQNAYGLLSIEQRLSIKRRKTNERIAFHSLQHHYVQHLKFRKTIGN